MGCDIHSYAEVRRDGRWEWVANLHPDSENEWERDEVYRWRNYNLFGFLANVRNCSRSPVIAEPRGLPTDASGPVLKEYSEWENDAHSASWLTLAEMQAYGYHQLIWDRRITREIRPGFFDGGALAVEGEGRHRSLREFLSETEYFRAMDLLATLGEPEDVRVVFWFDN